MIVYDCEIYKGILKKGEPPLEGIEYVSAQGQSAWRCFDEMGITVIGVYDYVDHRYRVFCQDNLKAFAELVANRDLIVGFNSISFDNRLCAANDIDVPDDKSYDLLVETWVAAGLSPSFQYPSHLGYSLSAIGEANGIGNKIGHGATAPVQWQRGEYGAVINYCLDDVQLTKRLLDMALNGESIKNPVNGADLRLRTP